VFYADLNFESLIFSSLILIGTVNEARYNSRCH